FNPSVFGGRFHMAMIFCSTLLRYTSASSVVPVAAVSTPSAIDRRSCRFNSLQGLKCHEAASDALANFRHKFDVQSFKAIRRIMVVWISVKRCVGDHYPPDNLGPKTAHD